MFIAFRERGKERDRQTERERERNIDWLPPIHAPIGDLTHNLGMRPGDLTCNLFFLIYGRHSNQPRHLAKGKTVFFEIRFIANDCLVPIISHDFFLNSELVREVRYSEKVVVSPFCRPEN